MRAIKTLSTSIEISAPPEHVWTFVRDVSRMPEWSPQVSSTRPEAGEAMTPGARFTNRNKQGELEWTTHGEIVRFEPNRCLSFRIEENWQIWSFEIEAHGAGGSRLEQRREGPDGLSDLSHELTEAFMGGQEAFDDDMLAGMKQTLERIKVACEQEAPHPAPGRAQ